MGLGSGGGAKVAIWARRCGSQQGRGSRNVVNRDEFQDAIAHAWSGRSRKSVILAISRSETVPTLRADRLTATVRADASMGLHHSTSGFLRRVLLGWPWFLTSLGLASIVRGATGVPDRNSKSKETHQNDGLDAAQERDFDLRVTPPSRAP